MAGDLKLQRKICKLPKSPPRRTPPPRSSVTAASVTETFGTSVPRDDDDSQSWRDLLLLSLDGEERRRTREKVAEREERRKRRAGRWPDEAQPAVPQAPKVPHVKVQSPNTVLRKAKNVVRERRRALEADGTNTDDQSALSAQDREEQQEPAPCMQFDVVRTSTSTSSSSSSDRGTGLREPQTTRESVLLALPAVEERELEEDVTSSDSSAECESSPSSSSETENSSESESDDEFCLPPRLTALDDFSVAVRRRHVILPEEGLGGVEDGTVALLGLAPSGIRAHLLADDNDLLLKADGVTEQVVAAGEAALAARDAQTHALVERLAEDDDVAIGLTHDTTSSSSLCSHSGSSGAEERDSDDSFSSDSWGEYGADQWEGRYWADNRRSKSARQRARRRQAKMRRHDKRRGFVRRHGPALKMLRGWMDRGANLVVGDSRSCPMGRALVTGAVGGVGPPAGREGGEGAADGGGIQGASGGDTAGGSGADNVFSFSGGSETTTIANTWHNPVVGGNPLGGFWRGGGGLRAAVAGAGGVANVGLLNHRWRPRASPETPLTRFLGRNHHHRLGQYTEVDFDWVKRKSERDARARKVLTGKTDRAGAVEDEEDKPSFRSRNIRGSRQAQRDPDVQVFSRFLSSDQMHLNRSAQMLLTRAVERNFLKQKVTNTFLVALLNGGLHLESHSGIALPMAFVSSSRDGVSAQHPQRPIWTSIPLGPNLPAEEEDEGQPERGPRALAVPGLLAGNWFGSAHTPAAKKAQAQAAASLLKAKQPSTANHQGSSSRDADSVNDQRSGSGVATEDGDADPTFDTADEKAATLTDVQMLLGCVLSYYRIPPSLLATWQAETFWKELQREVLQLLVGSPAGDVDGAPSTSPDAHGDQAQNGTTSARKSRVSAAAGVSANLAAALTAMLQHETPGGPAGGVHSRTSSVARKTIGARQTVARKTIPQAEHVPPSSGPSGQNSGGNGAAAPPGTQALQTLQQLVVRSGGGPINGNVMERALEASSRGTVFRFRGTQHKKTTLGRLGASQVGVGSEVLGGRPGGTTAKHSVLSTGGCGPRSRGGNSKWQSTLGSVGGRSMPSRYTRTGRATGNGRSGRATNRKTGGGGGPRRRNGSLGGYDTFQLAIIAETDEGVDEEVTSSTSEGSANNVRLPSYMRTTHAAARHRAEALRCNRGRWTPQATVESTASVGRADSGRSSRRVSSTRSGSPNGAAATAPDAQRTSWHEDLRRSTGGTRGAISESGWVRSSRVVQAKSTVRFGDEVSVSAFDVDVNRRSTRQQSRASVGPTGSLASNVASTSPAADAESTAQSQDSTTNVLTTEKRAPGGDRSVTLSQDDRSRMRAARIQNAFGSIDDDGDRAAGSASTGAKEVAEAAPAPGKSTLLPPHKASNDNVSVGKRVSRQSSTGSSADWNQLSIAKVFSRSTEISGRFRRTTRGASGTRGGVRFSTAAVASGSEGSGSATDSGTEAGAGAFAARASRRGSRRSQASGVISGKTTVTKPVGFESCVSQRLSRRSLFRGTGARQAAAAASMRASVASYERRSDTDNSVVRPNPAAALLGASGITSSAADLAAAAVRSDVDATGEIPGEMNMLRAYEGFLREKIKTGSVDNEQRETGGRGGGGGGASKRSAAADGRSDVRSVEFPHFLASFMEKKRLGLL